MENQRISSETAKLAKEKGFDPRRLEINCAVLYKGGVAYVSQSILQRWLREVHSINVHVLPIIKTDDEKVYYSWGIMGRGVIGYTCDPHRKGENYEEQLEEGLLTALSLI